MRLEIKVRAVRWRDSTAQGQKKNRPQIAVGQKKNRPQIALDKTKEGGNST